MSKAKIIAGAGIIAAGAALSGLPEPNAAKAESPQKKLQSALSRPLCKLQS